MKNIVIAGAVRTAIGSLRGSFADFSPVKLGSIAIKEAIKRAGLKPDQVDEVLMGCVLAGGHGQNIARQAALMAGIPIGAPAMALNMLCGSGLRSVVDAARIVALREANVVVAGGVESMSRAGYVLDKGREGYGYGNGELVDLILRDGLTCAINNVHMGVTAENVAETYGISRADQDKFSWESQQKTAKAIESGRFKDEIVPVEIPQKRGPAVMFSKDEYPKPGTALEKLGTLRTVFKKDGTVTAGNASGINDGAAAVLVMAQETANDLGVKPLVRIRGYAYAGVDPALMGMGPVDAVKKLLEKQELTIKDIDLIEANEAFAAQSLAVARQLGFDPAKVNVNGGAIALGHPIGASGTRILVTLIHEMKKRKSKLGIATLCVGGGMGIAMLVENI